MTCILSKSLCRLSVILVKVVWGCPCTWPSSFVTCLSTSVPLPPRSHCSMHDRSRTHLQLVYTSHYTNTSTNLLHLWLILSLFIQIQSAQICRLINCATWWLTFVEAARDGGACRCIVMSTLSIHANICVQSCQIGFTNERIMMYFCGPKHPKCL